MAENRFILAGVLGGIATFIIYLLGGNLIIAIASGAAAFALLAILMKPNKPAPVRLSANATADLPELIRQGEASLQTIREQTRSIANAEVKKRADEICQVVQRILETLKTKPNNVPNVRKFFNYYLPTLLHLLTRYGQMEKSGVESELQQKMIGYLGDILSAMNQLHANLYQGDILDMSVQMRAMTASCLQDGLLTSNDFRENQEVSS